MKNSVKLPTFHKMYEDGNFIIFPRKIRKILKIFEATLGKVLKKHKDKFFRDAQEISKK